MLTALAGLLVVFAAATASPPSSSARRVVSGNIAAGVVIGTSVITMAHFAGLPGPIVEAGFLLLSASMLLTFEPEGLSSFRSRSVMETTSASNGHEFAGDTLLHVMPIPAFIAEWEGAHPVLVAWNARFEEVAGSGLRRRQPLHSVLDVSRDGDPPNLAQTLHVLYESRRLATVRESTNPVWLSTRSERRAVMITASPVTDAELPSTLVVLRDVTRTAMLGEVQRAASNNLRRLVDPMATLHAYAELGVLGVTDAIDHEQVLSAARTITGSIERILNLYDTAEDTLDDRIVERALSPPSLEVALEG